MIITVRFDFATKAQEIVDGWTVPSVPEPDIYYWIDILDDHTQDAAGLLKHLNLPADVCAGMLGPDQEGRFDLYDNGIHMALSDAALQGEHIEQTHVDIFAGHHCLVTYRRREALFLQEMRRSYADDFYHYSQSPSFLLYEIGDHLARHYRRTLRTISCSVHALHRQLDQAPDSVQFLSQISRMTSHVVQLRISLLATREILSELSIRRSPFVNESTRSHLCDLAGSLQRLAEDATSDREFLGEILSLHVGLIDHRTGQMVNRLTTISIFFLPLTFLCGVYGMNLKIPETEWTYGYAIFWAAAVAIVIGLTFFVRRSRWLR